MSGGHSRVDYINYLLSHPADLESSTMRPPGSGGCHFTCVVACHRIKKFWPANIISLAIIFCVVNLKSAKSSKGSLKEKKTDVQFEVQKDGEGNTS